VRLILIAVFGAVGTLARYGLQGIVQVRTAVAGIRLANRF